MNAYHEHMSDLIDALGKLPGFGKRSAERVALHLLKTSPEESRRLGDLIAGIQANTKFCKICFHYTDEDICRVCADPSRDEGVICVVEDPKDVIAIEKTGTYSGLYHVLLGAMSALDGIGPEELKIAELIERVKNKNVREVILATNPNTEGDTTALYLSKIFEELPVKVSRLARGVPVGSHIEYTDQATLARALESRA